MSKFTDRDKMVELLQLAATQERTVIEFQNRDGELTAYEITDHVDKMETIVNGDN